MRLESSESNNLTYAKEDIDKGIFVDENNKPITINGETISIKSEGQKYRVNNANILIDPFTQEPLITDNKTHIILPTPTFVINIITDEANDEEEWGGVKIIDETRSELPTPPASRKPTIYEIPQTDIAEQEQYIPKDYEDAIREEWIRRNR